MPSLIRVAVTTTSLLAAAMAGCGGSGPSPSKAPPPPPGPKASGAPAAQPLSSVEASRVRERAIQVIEEASKSGDAPTRANAVEAASLLPGRLQAVVAAGLNDKSPAVRSVAAMAVGKAGITELGDRLDPLAGDPTPHVKASAIFALVKLGRDVDRSSLAPMLLEDSSPWNRRHAAYILGELGDRSALPLLRKAATQEMPEASREQATNLQIQIAEAMAKLGDENARLSLRAYLYPSRPEELETAALAAQVIGQIRDREARPQLTSMARYHDKAGNSYPPEVRLAVAGALAELGDPTPAQEAEGLCDSPAAPVRAQAAFVQGVLGERVAWGRLSRLLDDPEPLVRVAAAGAILRSGVKH